MVFFTFDIISTSAAIVLLSQHRGHMGDLQHSMPHVLGSQTSSTSAYVHYCLLPHSTFSPLHQSVTARSSCAPTNTLVSLYSTYCIPQHHNMHLRMSSGPIFMKRALEAAHITYHTFVRMCTVLAVYTQCGVDNLHTQWSEVCSH